MGRNSRGIRNREKGSGFVVNSNIWKIIVGVLLIVLVPTIIVWKAKSGSHTISIAEENSNISYEYFILSAEDGIGVIDKKGNEILKAKYTRN